MDMTAEPGQHYVACFDWGSRSPIATLAIATVRLREPLGVHSPLLRDVVLAQQWLLGGYVAIVEAARLCAAFDVTTAVTNHAAPRAVREHALALGLTLTHRETSDQDFLEMFESLRLKLQLEEVSFPADPFIKQDLLALFRHLSAQGRPAIYVPTAKTGRHAEYAPTIARVATMPCAAPAPKKVRRTSAERFLETEKKELEASERRLEARYTSRARREASDWSLAAFRSRVGR